MGVVSAPDQQVAARTPNKVWKVLYNRIEETETGSCGELWLTDSRLADSSFAESPPHPTIMAKDITLLWGSGSPPCWRVMIALEEKNLQGYNSKLLSFDKMEHKSQEVLDINPRGQVGRVIVGKICIKIFRLNIYDSLITLSVFISLIYNATNTARRNK